MVAVKPARARLMDGLGPKDRYFAAISLLRAPDAAAHGHHAGTELVEHLRRHMLGRATGGVDP